MAVRDFGPGDDDFDSDDFDDNDSDVQAFKDNVRRAKERDATDDEEEVEIDPTDNEPVVSVRKQKKQERGRLIDELKALREKDVARDRELAELRGMVQGAMHRQPGRDATDDGDDEDSELDDALADIQRRHGAAYQQLRAKGAQATQADKDAYEAESRRLERERIKLGADYAARRSAAGQQQFVHQQVIREQLRRDHGDVYAAGDRAVAYSRGEFQKLLALGHPDSAETVKKAMDATRIAFNIGRQPGPTPNQQRHFVAPPRGGSGGGGTDNGPQKIKMSKEFRQMADAMYPEERDDKKRYAKWANGPGRELLKSQRG